MDLKRLAQNARTAERNRRRIERTGLVPSGHKVWRRPEPENLSQHHPDYKAAMRLNVERTLPAHYSKAGRMGIAGKRAPEWTPAEISILRHGYARLSKAELMEQLPQRSWMAICRRARTMGEKRPRPPFKPTGDVVLDILFRRAHALGLTLGHLDEFMGRRYYERRKWKGGRREVGLHVRTIEELGGRLRARWPVGS